MTTTQPTNVSATTTGRRARKKVETRLALRAAAVRLALEHGYDRPRGESPLTALAAVFDDMADSYAARPEIWRDRLQVVRENPVLWSRLFASFSAFERALAHGVADRISADPDHDLYPGIVSAAVVGAVRVTGAHWRANVDVTSLRDAFASTFALRAAGLDTPRCLPPPAALP